MYSSSILLATLAATASASMRPLAVPMPKRALEARQTDSSFDSSFTDFPSASADSACLSATETLYSLYTEIPTAPADLESWAATAVETDSCSISVPASLTSEYSSYSSAVVSWYDANSAAISSAIAQCTDLEGDSSDLGGVCTSDVAAASGSATGSVASASATTTGGSSASTAGSGSATTTSSSSSSKTSSASSSASSTVVATAGAAAREVAVAGAVFAGVLGAVIAL